ncbi:MAG: low molecular weight phosphatase family protein [Candidatus Marsarchaeota archaeon]|nr:low molecular weight phosphatase family protein [Candidatus Marsarchaeota archaeon]
MTEKVLFVCRENAERSQIAEAYFNKFATKGAEAESAGADVTSRGAPPNNWVIESLKKDGIDVSMRKRKPLTEEMAARADMIVVLLTKDEADEFLPHFVKHSSKTVFWDMTLKLRHGFTSDDTHQALLEMLKTKAKRLADTLNDKKSRLKSLS